MNRRTLFQRLIAAPLAAVFAKLLPAKAEAVTFRGFPLKVNPTLDYVAGDTSAMSCVIQRDPELVRLEAAVKELLPTCDDPHFPNLFDVRAYFNPHQHNVAECCVEPGYRNKCRLIAMRPNETDLPEAEFKKLVRGRLKSTLSDVIDHYHAALDRLCQMDRDEEFDHVDSIIGYRVERPELGPGFFDEIVQCNGSLPKERAALVRKRISAGERITWIYRETP